MRKIQSFPVYPLLLAVYPAVALAASNLGQVDVATALRPGLLSLLGAGLVYALLRLLTRDWGRAALITGLAALLFFTYGHVFTSLRYLTVMNVPIGRHLYLAPPWLALFILGAIRLARVRSVSANLNTILNAVSLVLVVMASGQLASGLARRDLTPADTAAQNAPEFAAVSSLVRPENPPDVYFIVLDGYGREDLLRESFNLDNRPFLDELRKLGFILPNCAQSNYAHTALSITSAFYMDYQPVFNSRAHPGVRQDYLHLRQFFHTNPVRAGFKNLGYQVIAMETGFWWADMDDADVFLRASDDPVEQWQQSRDNNNFEELFVNTTGLRVISDEFPGVWKAVFPHLRTSARRRYDMIMSELDRFPSIPGLPGPKFVYAHFVAPHPPYIMNADGSFHPTGWDPVGYAPEVSYLNQRVLPLIRQILETSKTPPIIVLQGDHGWNPHRLRILSAYYLPGFDPVKLPDDITPVNTFRLIFDTYFGGQLGFLPNQSYESISDLVYNGELAPSTCVSEAAP